MLAPISPKITSLATASKVNARRSCPCRSGIFTRWASVSTAIGLRQIARGRGAGRAKTSAEVLKTVGRRVVKPPQPGAPAIADVKRIDEVDVLLAAVRIVESDSQIHHVALHGEGHSAHHQVEFLAAGVDRALRSSTEIRRPA